MGTRRARGSPLALSETRPTAPLAFALNESAHRADTLNRPMSPMSEEHLSAANAESRRRNQVIALASTLFVLLLVAGNFPGSPFAPPTRRIGFDQQWKMFTYPPHSPAGTAIFVEVDSQVRPVSPPGLVEFRWRRYVDSLRQSGTAAEWRCLALLVSQPAYGGTARRVTFASPTSDGTYRRVYSAEIGPPTIGSTPRTRCGTTDRILSDTARIRGAPMPSGPSGPSGASGPTGVSQSSGPSGASGLTGQPR